MYILSSITLIYIDYIFYATDRLSSYIYGFGTFCFLTYFISLIYSTWRRKNIINKLVEREDYRNVVVAGIDERGGRYYNYIYICEDTESNEIFKSDSIKEIYGFDFQVGDIVRLYQSHDDKEMYWVDLNHREPGNKADKLSKKKYGNTSFNDQKVSNQISIRDIIIFSILFSWLMVIISTSFLIVDIIKDGGITGHKDTLILIGISVWIFLVFLALHRYRYKLKRYYLEAKNNKKPPIT